MDDRRRDGRTNSTLRTKEQGTHLTLNEHGDDDDDESAIVKPKEFRSSKCVKFVCYVTCHTINLLNTDSPVTSRIFLHLVQNLFQTENHGFPNYKPTEN